MSATTDNSTRDAVLHELEWDPRVDASRIGVIARGGSVVLSGTASSLAHRDASVQAAERVYGVRAVADEIVIRLDSSHERDDGDIAASIAQQLSVHTAIPASVTAEVLDGHVTLRGAVSWSCERDGAVRAVRYLAGVTGVDNEIVVTP